jgi:DNA mismatch repair protein MutS2
MVEKLEQERRALDLARLDAEREAQSMRTRRRELDEEFERLKSKERAHITKEGEALMQSLKRAREDLRAAQARLRSGRLEEGEVRAAAKILDAVGAKVAMGGELEPRAVVASVARDAVSPAELRVGLRVYVPRLRAEAQIVEILGGGQLRVALGPLKLLTSTDEIRSTPSAAPPPPARNRGLQSDTHRASAIPTASEAEVPISTSENTVDLRGLRAHEAVAMAEQFLDRALGAGFRVAFLIHGHGTGALRDAVRDALGTSAYVARMRAGDRLEGGDGVTVVWLR